MQRTQVTENVKDLVSKAILKYKNYPSILEMQKYSKNKIIHFEEVNRRSQTEILKLDKTKASEKTDIPTRIIKEILICLENFCVRTQTVRLL